ncbi:cytidylyltransferase domain-containing protein [Shewanella marisflavi]|uniref:cytidylyltransferase domain-containing protein n=1 Tax=Shewanella marisflavi TaxID=260364 RepID=UPI003AAF26CB
MTKTLALVGARLNSSRLAGKHLLPLAGEPMIAHIWRRLERCKEIDCSELATTADSFNQPLVDWARERQITCHPFEGDVNDLMARLDKIIQRQDPDYILYVCGDCPLIDPEFIDHGLKALKSSGKDSIKLKEGIESLHEGLAFYSRAGWSKLMAASQCVMSREHVGYADKISPILDTLAIEDSADYSQMKHRISVDTQADYRFMSETYQRWYQDHDTNSIVNLLWVQQLLLDTPELQAINSHVQQKLPEKHYAKISLFCHIGPSIGLGHLKRCALIAEALQEQLGTGTEIFVIGQACELPWLHTKVCWLKDESQMLSLLKNDDNQLLILDFHPSFINEAALLPICQQLQQRGKSIVAMDKMSSLLPFAKLLFVPSFFTRLNDPKLSFGWDHFLFESVPHLPKENLVLFLTGGSDALGFGKSLTKAIQKSLRPEWHYIWVQGPLAPTPDLTGTENIELALNPPDLAELIARAKIVVTCYGLSLFESMSKKAAVILLPTLQLCEKDELACLTETNSCLITNTIEDAVDSLTRLQSSPEQIKQLSERAGSLFAGVDGVSIMIKKIKALLPADQRI